MEVRLTLQRPTGTPPPGGGLPLVGA
jgi:hypothetical protein